LGPEHRLTAAGTAGGQQSVDAIGEQKLAEISRPEAKKLANR
jgi:hypothetical protein